jgi:hypothetical protein
MTTAGGINSTEIISLIAIGFSLATLAVVRIKRRRPMKPTRLRHRSGQLHRFSRFP